MGSESTQSGSRRDAAAAALQKGLASARHAARTGLKLGRQHGPAVARRTADGLKRAGGAIRESERAKKIAAPARKAGRAAGRVVREKASKWPWLMKTAERATEATVRATRAARKHLVEERYFERSIRVLETQRKRYPAVDNAWAQLCHAFSMAPESSSTAPRAGTARRTPTAKKKTATRRKTAAKKSTTRKKTARKSTTRKSSRPA